MSLSAIFAGCATMYKTPYLERDANGCAKLFIEGKPFIVRGGELLNSSGSTAEDMAKHIEASKALNLNTVLLAVAWEQIEKNEGDFNFDELEKIISLAEANDLKLVLLWFGSWKNGFSGYVPHWVMRDTKRFPRVQNAKGENRPCLSPFSEEVLRADKRAFVELMQFIKRVDPQGKVVAMVQVENEIGLLDDSRDRSKIAENAFAQNVPQELIESLSKKGDDLLPEIREAWKANGMKKSGNWTEIFGQKNMLADEMFMAWHYGKFVDALAKEGKAVHNLPMFVNAWVISPDSPIAGKYPSGGPNYRMLDVWQVAAKNIDFFAPDNYLEDYCAKIADFARSGNPIFVPEACALWLGDKNSAQAKALYTIGEYGAIGFSPFGIDHAVYSPSHALGRAYEVIENLSAEITKAEAGKNMRGFMQQKNKSDTLDFGDIKVDISYSFPYKGYGLIIRLSKEDFLIAASGADLYFKSKSGKGIAYGLVREGSYKNGEWKTAKYLGGDEGGLVNLKFPPVYLREDADEGMISVVRAHIFEVDNSTSDNTQIF